LLCYHAAPRMAVGWRLLSSTPPCSEPHLQRISSSFNAKARDLLHEVDVHDRVRACTRCGTCSTLLGKPPKLNCPGKFTVLREVSQTACGIRECMKRVHVEVRVDRISEVGKQPAPSRYRSSTLSQTVRGGRRHAVPTPLLDGRKSVASRAHAKMCASIGALQQPNAERNQPAA
jgi:hypothetical protein